MFFAALLLGFAFAGTFIVMLDTFLPGVFLPIVAYFMKWLGLFLFWIGIILYLGRSYNTGAWMFEDLPKQGVVKLLHLGKSGARFYNAKKAEMNTLIYPQKKMRWRDMGHSILLAGHELQISAETVTPTMPIWLLDLIGKYKKKYGIKDATELKELYGKLKNVRDYGDVRGIEFLKPILVDPVKAKKLLDTPIEDIRLMAETIYTGETKDITSFLEFDESIAPYDNESIIGRTLAHRAEQRSSYRFAGGVDWGKMVIPIVILFIGGAIAFQMFAGG